DLQSILIGVQTVAGNPDTLAKLLNIDPQRRIVVNMSLGFGPPTDCLIGVYNHWQTLQQAEDAVVQKTGKASQATINCPTDKTTNTATPTAEANQPYRTSLDQLILGNGGAHAALTLPLSLAISNLRNVNKQIGAVVAAAGNESTRDTKLNADLPAAICGVLPVGATDVKSMLSLSSTPDPSGLGLADFSNRPLLDTNPDNSPRLCLAVSGGGEVGAPITVTLKQMDQPSMIAVGVNTCGIYASPVPPMAGTPTASPSPVHMAFWDGTSFATGFASGYVARQVIPDGGVFFVPDYQRCN
ncbi:MAG TPA: S8 family serine peptidase, partial [Ktedonobacterales bacterium]